MGCFCGQSWRQSHRIPGMGEKTGAARLQVMDDINEWVEIPSLMSSEPNNLKKQSQMMRSFGMILAGHPNFWSFVFLFDNTLQNHLQNQWALRKPLPLRPAMPLRLLLRHWTNWTWFDHIRSWWGTYGRFWTWLRYYCNTDCDQNLTRPSCLFFIQEAAAVASEVGAEVSKNFQVDPSKLGLGDGCGVFFFVCSFGSGDQTVPALVFTKSFINSCPRFLVNCNFFKLDFTVNLTIDLSKSDQKLTI